MNMPVAALLWPDHAKREPDTVLRMLEVLERRCLEMGAEDAAGHLAEAMEALRRETAERRLAA